MQGNRDMDQATIEWLANDGGNWIGCTKEGEVVYKDDEVKSAWEEDDRDVARRAKRFIEGWAKAKKNWAKIDAGDPNALGGQPSKDKELEIAANNVASYKAKAEEALDEAYIIF